MSTVITHIYNEEFLLPYWINHHKELFNHGIVVDFSSTDNSISIIREMAPDWRIIQSPFSEFDAQKLDLLIQNIEKDVIGPRMVLTLTEFFIGDPNLVRGQIIAPSVSLISQTFDEPFIPEKPFHLQRQWGLVSKTSTVTNDTFHFAKGNGRSLHDHEIKYPLGRHFIPILPSPFLVIRVNDCYLTEEMITRRLQIQHRIPKSDVKKGHGNEHTNQGMGLTRQDLMSRQAKQREISVWLGDLIKSSIDCQEYTTKELYRNHENSLNLQMWIHAVNNFRVEGPTVAYTAGYFFEEEMQFIKTSYESGKLFRISRAVKKCLRLKK